MSWPIPTLTKKELSSPPSLWFWSIFFISLQIIAIIIAIFILNYENPRQIVGLCLIPTILGWVILYVFWALKYIGSSLLTKYWNKEIDKTDSLWKEWGKNKIAILGNAVLTPEKNGVNDLLSDTPPVFPQKARPLHLHYLPIKELFEDIHQQLQNQYPNYKSNLQEIFLLLPETSSFKETEYQSTIKQQWDDRPCHVLHHIEEIFPIFNNKIETKKIILLLSLQLWDNNQKSYSEFITAQLLSSELFERKQNVNQTGGYIGRHMPLSLHNIKNDFKQFISYGCDDINKIKSIWTNNIEDSVNTNIILELEKQQISVSTHNINYSFGPSGPLSLILSIAIALEFAKKQQTEQLVFNKLQNDIILHRIFCS
ncbi:hypothetical protein [Commensalibacter oyaizuii]|uniref:Uncharacterized protein n=1 Tax=Commensalibacter oyaizuii TaxID=3043873 RepID=A0ABT6Q4G6_9PROT|nr:hypothetical protein [Commensalibacter sp. TBRC 16381]MDI2091863.1 hypothetical protein [Commensalibacter sp. TBRC 16381]